MLRWLRGPRKRHEARTRRSTPSRRCWSPPPRPAPAAPGPAGQPARPDRGAAASRRDHDPTAAAKLALRTWPAATWPAATRPERPDQGPRQRAGPAHRQGGCPTRRAVGVGTKAPAPCWWPPATTLAGCARSGRCDAVRVLADPGSSGKTIRHRLNRGGDHQANAALHRIVRVRLRYDPPPGTTWPGAPRRQVQAGGHRLPQALRGQGGLRSPLPDQPGQARRRLTSIAASTSGSVWRLKLERPVWVGSARGAPPVFPRVGFPGPPPEPGVP